MSEEKMLTIREVSQILNISEKNVIDFAENGQLPAYKIAGVYLRFKRQQVEEFRKNHKISPFQQHEEKKYSLNNKTSDFFYFNDFYILSLLIIALLLLIIFRG